MGEYEKTKTELFKALINIARTKHPEEIDKAYDYFWEEDHPEEFLNGVALDMAFINFEDWLLCDHKTGDGDGGERKPFVDLCASEINALGSSEKGIIEAMKGSVISLYEVTSTADGAKLSLKDILLDEEFDVQAEFLRALKPGDIFASRFLKVGEDRIMSGCIYPFSQGTKEKVLGFVNGQYERYTKNKNRDGSMRDFLSEETYAINMIWVSALYDK